MLFFRVFPVLWKIAKIFVDPKTRAKCVVLKNSELHKLCDYFDAENLPEEFGGTCRCENGCLPPVPKHMVSFRLSRGIVTSQIMMYMVYWYVIIQEQWVIHWYQWRSGFRHSHFSCRTLGQNIFTCPPC